MMDISIPLYLKAKYQLEIIHSHSIDKSVALEPKTHPLLVIHSPSPKDVTGLGFVFVLCDL